MLQKDIPRFRNEIIYEILHGRLLIVPSSEPSSYSMHLHSLPSRKAIVSSSSTIMSTKSNDYICHK